MKNYCKTFLIPFVLLWGISCQDTSLDPIQQDKIAKGTLLALRGTQLKHIYDENVPGASFYPNRIKGDEEFRFDAEFLSADLNSLESVDVYAVKLTPVSGKKTPDKEKVFIKKVPFSEFKQTSEYRNPWVTISIPLTTILSKIGMSDYTSAANQKLLFEVYSSLDPETEERSGGIVIETTLNLTNGVTVTPDLMVAPGLTQSDQFYPAQRLTYSILDVNDVVPSVQSVTFRKQAKSGAKTILPIKGGVSDTLDITFDQAIDALPTVSLSPNVGTLGSKVERDAKTKNQFYITYTTPATYTGNVTATISGATSAESGALNGSTQTPKKVVIPVDNVAPERKQNAINVPSVTYRVAKNGSVTMTFEFNEKLAKAPTITIDPKLTRIDPVTAKPTQLSADKLTVSYTYIYADADNNAVHGLVDLWLNDVTDEAGNTVSQLRAITNLVIDIATPPAPTMTLSSPHDYGTQIKWRIQARNNSQINLGGSETGTVYYVIRSATDAAPDGFVPGDNPVFTVSNPTLTLPVAGKISVVNGQSGNVFSPFPDNGTFKVYFVFVSDTGNVSTISRGFDVTMN